MKQAGVGAVVGAVTTPGANLAVKAGMNSFAAAATQGALASAVSQEVVKGKVSLKETAIAAVMAPVAQAVEVTATALGATQLGANAAGSFIGASGETLVGAYADILTADPSSTGSDNSAACPVPDDRYK